jgi:hypothetical protein
MTTATPVNAEVTMRLVLPFGFALAADPGAQAVEAPVAQIDWAEPGLGSLEEADWEAVQVSVVVLVEAAEALAASLARSAAVAAEEESVWVD